ncbi:hypothetical protein [Flavobacterium capsici]|uniref:DUF3300 domain-containing protein n=1 Tax=Flavobacterium capsici TaxID=3075618 RepID=A0AA96JB90_9FLAO|nr:MULTISPECIES: hypothetical protein [unclassified Flavobacterium]WNM18343.1 hypothetical protein RN608_09985 [Flavobacterium sp. PMR2A8]WNM22394.1 hypothetical protein RN605_03285 [Flavobacterium sp. PMTSA4]
MKTLKIFIATMLLVMTTQTKAQVSVSINIGTPPVWAPAAPVNVNYYYLPEIETYYDVSARHYIFLNNGVWVRSRALPAYYSGYDLNHCSPVYLTGYRGNEPYMYYKQHKVKYKGHGKWKNNHGSHRGKGKKVGHYKS